jgi:hypothetical protein
MYHTVRFALGCIAQLGRDVVPWGDLHGLARQWPSKMRLATCVTAALSCICTAIFRSGIFGNRIVEFQRSVYDDSCRLESRASFQCRLVVDIASGNACKGKGGAGEVLDECDIIQRAVRACA